MAKPAGTKGGPRAKPKFVIVPSCETGPGTTLDPTLSRTFVSAGLRTSPALTPVPATAAVTNCVPSLRARTSVSGPPASGLACAANAVGDPFVEVTPGASASKVEPNPEVNEETYSAAWVASSLSSA